MSVRMKSVGALALVAGMMGAMPPVAPDARAVVAMDCAGKRYIVI